MATMLGSLLISLGLNSGQFHSGMTAAERKVIAFEKQVQRTAGAMQDLGARMTLGITAPLVAFGAFAVKAASDAHELQSAFDQTFGALSKEMTEWARVTGDAMGRSTQEIQQGANTFGIFFNQAAKTRGEAAELSKTFSVLAQDLSSFFNVDPKVAMEKLRSGLAGEAEPLRDFGVFLTEATVKAKAMEMGLAKSEKEITEQNKVLARAQLILQATSVAQGDVARTADGTANRVRAARAAFEELQVAIGEKLIPAITPLIEALTGLLNGFSALPSGIQTAIVAIAGLLAVTGPLLYLVGSARIGLSMLRSAFTVAGGGGGVMAGAMATLTNALSMAGGAIVRLGGLVSRFLGPIGLIIGAILLFKDQILDAFKIVTNYASSALGPAFDRLSAAVKRAVERLSALWQRFAESDFGRYVLAIVDGVGRMIGAFLSIAGGAVVFALELIIGFMTTIADTITFMVDYTSAILSGDWQRAWSIAGTYVERIIDNMFPAFQNLWGWIQDTLAYLGLMEQRAASAAQVAAVGSMSGAGEAGVSAVKKAAGYVPPAPTGKPTGAPKGRKGGGGGSKSGPSAEELAYRQETLAIDHAIAVARERGDLDAQRRLERQRDLRDAIKRYEDAGLSTALARVAAEKDIAEMDAARAEAQAKALARSEVEFDLELAQLRNDQAAIRNLEEKLFLEDRITHFREHGLSLAEAEQQAQEDLLAIEDARADAAARRLADAQTAHEIELARLRGDESTAGRLDEERRIRDRAGELEREGQSPADAQAQAELEAMERTRAARIGHIRSTLHEGLRAALDGNFWDWLKGKWRDTVFDALSKVLDRLTDRFLDILVPQDGGGGGGLGGLLAGLGGLFGGAGGAGGISVAAGSGIAKMNFGGFRAAGGPVLAGKSYIVGEKGPELLRMGANGSVIPNHELRRMNASAGEGRLVIEDTTGLFRFRSEGIAGEVVSATSSAVMEGGAQTAATRLSRSQRRTLG